MKDTPSNVLLEFEQHKKHVFEMVRAYAAKKARMPIRSVLKPRRELTPERLLAQTDDRTRLSVLRTVQPFCTPDQWRRLLVEDRLTSEVPDGVDDGESAWAMEHNVEFTPERLLGWTHGGSRLPVLLALRELCDLGEWYRLLGEHWSGCDNIGAFRGQLTAAFKSDDWVDVERMMSDEERAARDALPATITVYRGCYEHNQRGLSYSLDRDIAAEFPYYRRYRSEGQPLLVTVKLRRAKAIVKLDREEREVIAINPRIIAVEELPGKNNVRCQAELQVHHANCIGPPAVRK